MKTADLIGPALEWAVASIEYPNDLMVREAMLMAAFCSYDFSTFWAEGGPIIERERLILRPSFDGGWECAASPSVWRSGPTPLIAAMRCFVASKLGDEVDVPRELL